MAQCFRCRGSKYSIGYFSVRNAFNWHRSRDPGVSPDLVFVLPKSPMDHYHNVVIG